MKNLARMEHAELVSHAEDLSRKLQHQRKVHSDKDASLTRTRAQRDEARAAADALRHSIREIAEENGRLKTQLGI